LRNRNILAALVCSFLLGLSPLAAADSTDSTIQRGIDAFTTLGSGTTSYDFAQTPIPAGFFCKDSKPFTGRVKFKGLPLTTGTPGQLGDADTVIERLDDAVFDADGIATTRIQFRALSLVSIAPIKTTCGAFHVYVTLNGRQRATTMSIFRTQEGGGNFVAPLAVDAKVTFIPVKPQRNKARQKLEITTSLNFPASPLPWSLTTGTKRTGPVAVDTNGDLIPDALVPGTSNFLPGEHRARTKALSGGGCSCCPSETCHPDYGDQHCTLTPACPGMENCC